MDFLPIQATVERQGAGYPQQMAVAPKTFYVAGKLINTYYVKLVDIINIEWALSDSGLLDEEV